jgi:hypothetical protein
VLASGVKWLKSGSTTSGAAKVSSTTTGTVKTQNQSHQRLGERRISA